MTQYVTIDVDVLATLIRFADKHADYLADLAADVEGDEPEAFDEYTEGLDECEAAVTQARMVLDGTA